LVSSATPEYTPMSVLFATGFDTDYLVGKFSYYDFIGILISVGTERELNRTGKMIKLNAISIEVDE